MNNSALMSDDLANLRANVLFVDDEQNVLQGLRRTFRREGYDVYTSASAEEAFEVLNSTKINIVVSDENMPKMRGIEFLSNVKKQYPETIRMMLTGNANLDMALTAINKGEIFRFFTKPYNLMELRVGITQAIQQQELMSQAYRLLETVRKQSYYIEYLENDFPGISQVDRDDDGTVIIESAYNISDADKLIEDLLSEIDRVELRWKK